MATTVITKTQTFELNPITDVVITTTAYDEVEGDYYRDFTFFGERVGETTPVIMTIRIRALTTDPLTVDSPAGKF